MKVTLKAKHAVGKPAAVVELPKKKAAPVEAEESNDESGEEEEQEFEDDDDDDNDDGDDDDGDDGDDDNDDGDDEDADDDDALPADDNFDEDDDAEEGAVGFADAMSKVLNQNVEQEKAPILAKRVTSQMREISKDKSTTKESKMSAKEKRAREEKDMVIPSHQTMAQDKALRGIATKGVVALFNAIAKHQHGQQQQDGSKQIKSLSKDSFLGLLKQQGKKKEAAAPQPEEDGSDEGEDKSSWSVVQDDYMMGAKLKDFDKDDDAGNEDDDVWNAAQDHLDSDNEDGGKKKTKTKANAKANGKKGGNHKAQKKQRTR